MPHIQHHPQRALPETSVTSMVRVVIISAGAHKGPEAQALKAGPATTVGMKVTMEKTVPMSSGHLKQHNQMGT